MDKVKIVWDKMRDEIYTIFGTCQNCKCASIIRGYNYCPECGKEIDKDN